MRWLFIAVLTILIGSVLSIVWMNDDGSWPTGNNRRDGTQPSQPDPLLAPAPPSDL